MRLRPKRCSRADNNLVFDLQGDGFQPPPPAGNQAPKSPTLTRCSVFPSSFFPIKPAAFTCKACGQPLKSQLPGATTVVCPVLPAIPATSSPLELYLPSDAQPQQFGLVEFDLATTTVFKNPFDPDQADLVVHYTAPNGKTMTIPAFWYQAYDATGSSPCGKPGWKARLTPTLTGQWRAQAELVSQHILSDKVSFQVTASTSKGFVRLNSNNPHYLAFDNGETFFPIGLNIGWWQSDPLKDYQRWMDELHQNNGSIMRVWMADWSFGIEWNDTGLGDIPSACARHGCWTGI